MKQPNKDRQRSLLAEDVEERDLAKGNMAQQNASRTQRRNKNASHALARVREAAKRDRSVKFTALFHHITVDLLRQSFNDLNRDSAAGVDGVMWHDYEQALESNLQVLHERLHRGAYRSKAVRRVFIPKSDGQKRPLGIAAMEDKIVQSAVVRLLNAIYEEDFVGFSYGFRPGRSQHQALDALAVGIDSKKVNWVLDADIRGYFDAIDHGWLRRFIEHRIADKRLLRLINKWLSAGVIEDGVKTRSTHGCPQGAPISPLLANVFLHYVFDLLANHVRKQCRGDVVMVRYADDIVVGFQYEDEARRFLSELGNRFAKFGLELHAGKTKLIRFGRFAKRERQRDGERKPETFDFLGFTHICGVTRKGDRFGLLRYTKKAKLRSSISDIRLELMRRRHLPIPIQGAWLRRVVQGHFAYFAVPNNIKRLGVFRDQVSRAWLRALKRRSQRHRMTWERFSRLITGWIPPARILHPWPEERFDAITLGRSRVR